MSDTSRYRTGEFLIDLGAREIRRDGHTVNLEAKAFDLIALLLVARDRALSKRELNQALWGERPVTEAALSQQLRKARRALGDDGDAQAVIRTVHGRGLRWVAPVTLDDTPAALPAIDPAAIRPPAPTDVTASIPARRYATERTQRPLRVLAAVAVLTILAAVFLLQRGSREDHAATYTSRRIAVMPVTDATGETALAWAPAGLMGLMTSLFEQQGGIEVVPAQTVQAAVPSDFRTDAAALQRLRHSLGASHLVVAGLHRLGPIYELTVRLVAAGNAERHDTLHGSEPAALAAAAVARVRRWLDLQPVASAGPEAVGDAGSFESEAYARGLDAQLHGDADAAKKYFSICLDRDPGLAWPRLGLARAQAQSGESAQARENAGRVAAAARERNDGELLVPSLHLLASLAFFGGHLDQATAYLDEALGHVSATEHPLALVDLLVAYGSIEDERGDPMRSRQHFEQALKLARDSDNHRGEASVLINLASLDNGAGDAAAAASDLRAGLDAARAAGDSHLEGATLGNLGATEANQGHMLVAIGLLKQGIAFARQRADSNLQVLAAAQLVSVMAPFGHDAVVRQLAERILDAADRAKNPYWQAEAHAALADLATRRRDWPRALSELEHARALYAGAGMTRDEGEMLARTIETAVQTGDAAQAHRAAEAFRALATTGTAAMQWRPWLPVIAAQLRAADGDVAGAADDLSRTLDDARGATGPAAQAGLFQLGRWQVALGRGADLLARPEWKPWLREDPDAIALRVAALRATGRGEEADNAQQRLNALMHAPELDLDPSFLAAF